MRRIAACACGQLRIATEGEPDRVLACNCRECQRRTGSAFGVSAYFVRSRIGMIAGESKTFSRTTDDSIRFDTSFCPICGSSVFWHSSAMPGHLAIAVGCFADLAFPPPDIVAWTSEKHGWVSFPAACRSFDGSAFGRDVHDAQR